jgi:hypothetical protein
VLPSRAPDAKPPPPAGSQESTSKLPPPQVQRPTGWSPADAVAPHAQELPRVGCHPWQRGWRTWRGPGGGFARGDASSPAAVTR